MAIEITMPRLSDTMEEGTLIKWRVQVGDEVASGDILADVETDKATMELQSYDDGTVARLAAEEGQTLPVGALIVVLAEDGESVEEAAASVTPREAAAAPAMEADKETEAKEDDTPPDREGRVAPPPPAGGGRTRVSPVARKIAEEHDVDLAAIRGSGPDGRIIKRDVLAAVEGTPPEAAARAAPPAAPPAAIPVSSAKVEAKSVPLGGMRKTIAKRLLESKTTIPHFTVTVAADMDPLLEMRRTINAQLESQGVKLSVNDFIVRAVAVALVRHPEINASWAGDTIEQHGEINVGVAVALSADQGGGLVVPVIRNAHRTGLREISETTRALATKARETGLSPDDMAGGTFTISNLGMLGVEHFEAIINPPQAAILAVGAALQKAMVRDGELTVGHEMTCTMSCDHRVIDGAMAAEYLQTLKALLESPAAMLV